MTEISFLLLLLGIVVLLLVQLAVLGHLRDLRGRIDATIVSNETRRESAEFAKVEYARKAQSRRVKYRSPAHLVVELSVLGKTISGTAQDISETGLLFHGAAKDAIEVGESYPALILIPDSEKIELQLRMVRWVDEASAFGACFEGISLEAKRRIREFVNRQAKKELSSSLKDVQS